MFITSFICTANAVTWFAVAAAAAAATAVKVASAAGAAAAKGSAVAAATSSLGKSSCAAFASAATAAAAVASPIVFSSCSPRFLNLSFVFSSMSNSVLQRPAARTSLPSSIVKPTVPSSGVQFRRDIFSSNTPMSVLNCAMRVTFTCSSFATPSRRSSSSATMLETIVTRLS